MRIVPVEPTKNDFYVIVGTKTKRLCRVDIYNSSLVVFRISKSYISFRLAKFFSSVIPPHLHSLSKKPTESHSASLRGLITEDYPMATGRVLILILIGIQGPSAIRHANPRPGIMNFFGHPSVCRWVFGSVACPPLRHPPQPQLAYCPRHCQLQNGSRKGMGWL